MKLRVTCVTTILKQATRSSTASAESFVKRSEKELSSNGKGNGKGKGKKAAAEDSDIEYDKSAVAGDSERPHPELHQAS